MFYLWTSHYCGVTIFRFNFLCEVSWACMRQWREIIAGELLWEKPLMSDVGCLWLCWACCMMRPPGVWVPRALESLNPLKLWVYTGPSSPTMAPQTVFFLGKEGIGWQWTKDACLLQSPGPEAVGRGWLWHGPQPMVSLGVSPKPEAWALDISDFKVRFTKLCRVPTQYLFC